MKHIHILGIGGTFMAGLAQLAVQAGFRVTGSDQRVYPPMSDQLEALGIELSEGYDESCLDLNPDAVVVGNVMSRGMPVIEALLDRRIPYYSGPQWLYENVLQQRQVIAVTGTHGKTTTTSLVSWLLRQAGVDCGYLIGGVSQGFERSADLGSSPWFVIEADEYDSAFFDKRSKFLHYGPEVLLINNLEFDHADIFSDLGAIQWQFEQLLRLLPSTGSVIYPAEDQAVVDTLDRGCWSQRCSWGKSKGNVKWKKKTDDGTEFELSQDGKTLALSWAMLGEHNVMNATAAIAAARIVGLTDDSISQGIQGFPGIKRRLERLGEFKGVTVYDDFAHHPTSIRQGIKAIRQIAKPGQRVVVLIEFASYTMRSGQHQNQMTGLFDGADAVFMLDPQGEWDSSSWQKNFSGHVALAKASDELLAGVLAYATSGDHVVIMSNRSFDGIHQKLIQSLESS